MDGYFIREDDFQVLSEQAPALRKLAVPLQRVGRLRWHKNWSGSLAGTGGGADLYPSMITPNSLTLDDDGKSLFILAPPKGSLW